MLNEDAAYSYFCRRIKDLAGIDLLSYKSTQMQRRLKTIMAKNGANDYLAYVKVLERDSAKLKEFKDFVTINVSEFFRNPDKFEELKNKILPELVHNNPRPKIWSAGCSNGAEAYSVAIIMDELGYGRSARIIATDIDQTILGVARQGRYQPNDVNNVSEERKRRYFTTDGRSYQVIEELRNRVEFRAHDLLKDPYETGFDLILCRNVIIYFTDNAKEHVFRGFHRSLRDSGVLFIGGTESILRAREMGFVSISPLFYRKMEGA